MSVDVSLRSKKRITVKYVACKPGFFLAKQEKKKILAIYLKNKSKVKSYPCLRGQGCNFVIQSVLICLNLKRQFVEHVG